MKSNKIISYFFKAILFLLLLSLSLRIILIVNSTFAMLPEGGSIDLRNRVVGTRVALLSKNPYSYSWKQGDPVTLLDPLNPPNAPSSRLTITPAALLTHIPFANIQFSRTIYAWYVLEWILLFASIFLLIKSTKNKLIKYLILITGLLFGNSAIWITHILLGQIYIVYTFILAITTYLITQKQFNKSFFLVSILILFRPTYILLLSFFFNNNYNRYFKSTIYTIISTLVITLAVFNSMIWSQYLKSMNGLSRIPPRVNDRGFDPLTTYPKHIENWKLNDTEYDFALERENSFRGEFTEWTNNALSPFHWITTIIALFLTYLVFVFNRINKRGPLMILFTASLFGLLAEYLLPARRYIYADIQWLSIIGILLIIARKQKWFQT